MTSPNSLSLILTLLLISWCIPNKPSHWTREIPRKERLQGHSPKKRALLVGISEYEHGHLVGVEDWWNLHSSADVDSIEKVLRSKRYEFDDVRVLKTREQTTHKAIIDAFRSFLIKETQAGDIVYFHYSGHGSQIPDPTNRKLNGKHECLVPSDYKSMTDGSNNILDDEIRDLLTELKTKAPGGVFLTFDSCFAGTITRSGRHLVRGRKWNGPMPTRVPVVPVGDKESKGPGGFLTRGKSDQLGYVALTATDADQLASETDGFDGEEMGLLSYSLVNALSGAKPLTTYQDLFEQIRQEMAQKSNEQTPQLDGAKNNELMGGRVLPPAPYFDVVVMDERQIVLQAGQLQGMTKGSRFAAYKPGTRDFKNAVPIAETTIANLDLNSATLELTRESLAAGIKPKDLKATRAIEKSHEYGENGLKVNMASIAGTAQGETIITQINALPLVDADPRGGNWDVRICRGNCDDEKNDSDEPTATPQNVYTIERSDGSVIVRVKDGNDQKMLIRQALEGESRWEFVNKLVNKNPQSKVKIEVRLVPVDVTATSDCGDLRTDTHVDKAVELKPGVGGLRRLARCTYVMMELKNLGDKDVYVTIVDLLRNGRIGPLWPDPHSDVQDNKVIHDQQWHRVPFPYVIRIDSDEPLGTEVFKAIATTEPADFSPLLDANLRRGPRGPSEANAANSPLGKLLRATTQGQRAGRAGLDPSDWSTATVTFDVIKRQ